MSKADIRYRKFFFGTVITVLFVTFISKVLMLLSGIKLLAADDEVFGIKNWLVIGGACLIELGLIACIISRLNVSVKNLLILLVALCFGTYRAFLQFGGFVKQCSCLGRFPQILHISNGMLSTLMWALLAYMAGGAIVLLVSKPTTSESGQ